MLIGVNCLNNMLSTYCNGVETSEFDTFTAEMEASFFKFIFSDS